MRLLAFSKDFLTQCTGEIHMMHKPTRMISAADHLFNIGGSFHLRVNGSGNDFFQE